MDIVNNHTQKNDIESVAEMYDVFEKSHEHVLVTLILFFSLALYISLLRYLFSYLRFHPPTEPFLFITGLLIGSVCYYLPQGKKYLKVVHGNLSEWKLIVLPLMFYKICLFTDFYRIQTIFLQALSFGISGLLLSACVIGYTLNITEDNAITVEQSLIFGLLCVPIYPAIPIGQQKLFSTAYSQVGSLLEGECLTGTTIAFILLDIFVKMRLYHSLEMFISNMLVYLVAGAVIGWICGLAHSKLLEKFSDLPILIMSMFFVPLSIYVLVHFLGLNENLAFLIQAISICKQRSSYRNDVDQFFVKFVTVSSIIFTDVVVIYIGMFLAEGYALETIRFNFALIVCMYIVSTCGRFFSFIVLSVILSKFDCGLSVIDMGLAIWCGIPSLINIFMALELYDKYNSLLSNYGENIPGNISAFVILGYLINGWTTPFILTRLGLSFLPSVRDINMNLCFQRIMDVRRNLLLMLKLDRMFCDAHWLIIREGSVLTHPYWKTRSNVKDEQESFRFAVCNHCNLEFSVPPTYKEYQEISREARKRVLNAKKNFYVQQHEHGMLSIESCRTLISVINQGLNTPDVEFSIEPLMMIFKTVNMVEYKHAKLFNTFEYAHGFENSDQLNCCQKMCIRMIVHSVFDVTINMIVICNVIINIIFLTVELDEIYSRFFFQLVISFCSIYILEMIIKIFVLSSGRTCDGVYNYFRCMWNTLDFIFMSTTLSELILEQLETHNHLLLQVSTVMSFRIWRITRLLKLCTRCQYFTTDLQRSYENSIAYRAYETGKTFIKGEQELMLIIPGMVNNTIITEEILSDIEKDVAIITLELGRIQKNLPQVATNFKTKQAIRTTLNSMFEEIERSQVSGWIEENEFKMLMKSMQERYQFLSHLTNVEWVCPKTLFQEISWLSGYPQLTEDLYSKVQIKKYARDEFVIRNGELAEGVYIVLFGLLKVEYEPSKFVLNQLKTYGALPVMDYIADTNFRVTKTDFIVCGNSFGELSLLTGRPYACNLIADTSCELYLISNNDIRFAMMTDNDPIKGLESRMWEASCSGLVFHILTTASPYRTIPPDEVRLFLNRCFVPNLSTFSRFQKTNFIEDIILIEGAILDQDSQEYFVAPRHLPRSVRDMALPGNSNYALNTIIDVKFVIIMKLNVKPEIIMDEIRLIIDEDI